MVAQPNSSKESVRSSHIVAGCLVGAICHSSSAPPAPESVSLCEGIVARGRGGHVNSPACPISGKSSKQASPTYASPEGSRGLGSFGFISGKQQRHSFCSCNARSAGT